MPENKVAVGLSAAPAASRNLARRVEVLEAAVFRLSSELDRLRGASSDAPPSSSRSQKAILGAIARRVHADGGETKVTASALADEVGLHQTYVSAILKTLEAEGRLIASGKRVRTYRLPDFARAVQSDRC